MKHTAMRLAHLAALPTGWRKAEASALRANAADTCDDRVSENIFDVEDEWAEVGLIVHGLTHGAN